VRSGARSIVVGYDGSESARRALARAADLAGYGALVTAVHVVGAAGGEPPAAAAPAPPLAEARAFLAARQVSARALERAGDPAAELVAVAHELEAELLVVGDGRAGGAVSASVVRDAPCDVLVVRGRGAQPGSR
jgi:nucleotide-binding universal stress UspA family protein